MYIREAEFNRAFNDDILKASTFGLKVGQSVKVEKVVESAERELLSTERLQ